MHMHGDYRAQSAYLLSSLHTHLSRGGCSYRLQSPLEQGRARGGGKGGRRKKKEDREHVGKILSSWGGWS